MLYWPISSSASHLRPPHSSSNSTVARGPHLVMAVVQRSSVCDGFAFYHGRLSFWSRLGRIGWVPPWAVASCSFFQSVEHIVGYQLHRCPRSEQASTDRCIACTVAILARSHMLLKTPGISVATSSGSCCQPLFSVGLVLLCLWRDRNSAPACSPPPGKCISYVLFKYFPITVKEEAPLLLFVIMHLCFSSF